MQSLESAYDALVQAADRSAQSGQYQSTTSLAPELGLRELSGQKNRRDYERDEGGRSLILMWRQAEIDPDHPSRHKHVLTVVLLNEGVTERRHSTKFES